MSCPNVKVKFVKMSDTKFYCCDEQKEIQDFLEEHNQKQTDNYCFNCGQRLSINGYA